MPIKPIIGAGGEFDGGGASGDWGGTAVSYKVTNASKKVTEAFSTVLASRGGVGDYKKIAANAKSFTKMHSESLLDRGVISNISAPKIDHSGLNDLSFLAGPTETAESTASAAQVNAATGQVNGKSSHRVKLEIIGSDWDDDQNVIFDVLPEIVEQHTIEYEAIAPPQFPGAFQKYKGNSSTQWTLNATFISRTTSEATKNYNNLMKLRGWTKPYYGERSGEAYPGRLGAPPPILLLSGLRNLIGPMPVVITSLNWTWPRDVDYIETGIMGPDGKPVPFPSVLQVPVQLVESLSIDQFNQFSLADYRAGNMTTAFNNMSTSEGVGRQRLYSSGAQATVAGTEAQTQAASIGKTRS